MPIPDSFKRLVPPGLNRRSIAIGGLTILFCALFVALGIWQLERRTWKLDLIARVEARVHAVAIPAPSPADWPSVNAADDEYRHVSISGHFDNDRETLVFASTVRGPGYWVVTPLIQADGSAVFVNRGFVPVDRKDPQSRPESTTTGRISLTGLIRMNEPDGTFLRANQPDQDRWYSRDVVAMGRKLGIQRVAPFFIDADQQPNPDRLPVGGLTVIRFPNSHLSYAMTWFAMAMMSLVGGYIALRTARRR